MKVGQKIEFIYNGRRRFGRITKTKISNEGRKIITLWIPAERQYKAFRQSDMRNIKIVRGFIESLFTLWC